jgi:hypothetical protein
MKSGRPSIGTVEELEDEARQLSGLDDFGATEYVEGLQVLLDSYEREAGLTPWGNRINHAMLRGALVGRLMSEAAIRQHDAHKDVRIERPIIVTGLPRTGTTALHRLLCEDPRHQGLEMWLTEAPQPRPPRETWDANPTFQRIQERYRNHYVQSPEFMGVHEISADLPDECWQLLRQSMMSISFETTAHIPTYAAWLERQDMTLAYERHRANLQIIGLRDDRRWVLKNPGHLFALPALLSVYPDALIIVTHREPRDVIASVSSLTAQAAAGQSETFVGEVVGRVQLELWARGAERFMADRSSYDPSRFFDVRYDEFVADPLATISGIFAHFGMAFPEQARSAMASLEREAASGPPLPRHTYDLGEFGLTAAEVDERFAAYRAANLD